MKSIIIVLALFTVACAAPPPAPPEEVATSLIEDLDAGRTDAADDLFARVADDASYREKIYPILYVTARDRYRQRDSAGAAQLLRFMAPRYPKAKAVREALLYSLFLERAQRDAPDPDLSEEIDDALAEIRASEMEAPLWVDLVSSQQAIDRGELAVAREALTQFLARWEGQPPDLLAYVEDLERYLSTH